MKTVDEWKQLLRARIRAAMGERDRPALAVLRVTLAALENAEAPPMREASSCVDGPFAGSAGALGAGEAPRLVLSPETVIVLIDRELNERREAIAEYLRLGRQDEAEVLSVQAKLLAELLAEAGRTDDR